jgi:UDP-N-acetyl-alpha-D-muramoyl-L-alanyl-L-glutamate epimerase
MNNAVFSFDGYRVNTHFTEIFFNYSYILPTETISFTEKLTLPIVPKGVSSVPPLLLQHLLENLHFILGISYWKLYCAKKIEIPGNMLTSEQAAFWNTVYTKGLGEFFYKNNIDFRGLVQFPHDEKGIANPVDEYIVQDRSLLMLGGGKDSLVSAELLRKNKKPFTAFVVNDYSIQQPIIEKLGVDKLVIKREIDKTLLELNQKAGAHNGHVPVSAIYAFLGLLTAVIYDYKYIVASNEKSANYGNVEYLGEVVNHQWSKSFEFEKLFVDYVKTYITPSVSYYSLLRKYSELEITEMFAKQKNYFPLFSSCNKNFTIEKKSGKKWCGECPKCAFVFSMLATFLSKDEVVKIFGKNLYADEKLIDTYKELLGIKDIKPFECVGTPEEVREAFQKAKEKGEYKEDVVMKIFTNI